MKTLPLVYSTLITSILIVFLTIYSEINESFKNYISSFTSHHWISKSILTITSYILFYLIFSIFAKDKNIKSKSVYLVIIFAILSYVAILVFFIYQFIQAK